jgi:hypothetical protein
MNACRECRFFDDEWGFQCRHPQIIVPDAIHGAVMQGCREARKTEPCGPDGKLWERRQSVLSRLAALVVH